jgi:hypothetical protein
MSSKGYLKAIQGNSLAQRRRDATNRLRRLRSLRERALP